MSFSGMYFANEAKAQDEIKSSIKIHHKKGKKSGGAQQGVELGGIYSVVTNAHDNQVEKTALGSVVN